MGKTLITLKDSNILLGRAILHAINDIRPAILIESLMLLLVLTILVRHRCDDAAVWWYENVSVGCNLSFILSPEHPGASGCHHFMIVLETAQANLFLLFDGSASDVTPAAGSR